MAIFSRIDPIYVHEDMKIVHRDGSHNFTDKNRPIKAIFNSKGKIIIGKIPKLLKNYPTLAKLIFSSTYFN